MEKYHYIHYSNGAAELYDLEKDPNEWENLANHPELKEVIEEFDAGTANGKCSCLTLFDHAG